MKIKFVILVSLLVLNSCQFKKSEQELNKSEQELNKEYGLMPTSSKIISLKDSSSYNDICILVRKNTDQRIRSVVEIMDGEILKTVRLQSVSDGGHRKEINMMEMTLDSIRSYDTGTLPRKKLKIALKKFYEKRGDRGYVEILLTPTSTSKELESLLLNLIQEFDKMNSETEQSYDLHIFLSDLYPITLPLPQN